MESFFTNYEHTNPLERFENQDGAAYEFESAQMEYIEDSLSGICPEGNLSQIGQSGVEEIVASIDSRIGKIRPDIPTKINFSNIGLENDTWREFREMLEPKYLEAPTDRVQQEMIAKEMVGCDEIRFENWSQLSATEQVEALNQLEQKIAKIAHRPACSLRAEPMRKGLFGYQVNGTIAINTHWLEVSKSDPTRLDRMLDTLIHEGRHSYQHYNVEVRLVHESKAEVESWRENFEVLGYASGEPVYISVLGIPYTNKGMSRVGARLYYYQPVEIDARNFAKDTLIKYHELLNA